MRSEDLKKAAVKANLLFVHEIYPIGAKLIYFYIKANKLLTGPTSAHNALSSSSMLIS